MLPLVKPQLGSNTLLEFILNIYYIYLFSTKDGCRQGIHYDGDIAVSRSGKHCIEWEPLQYWLDNLSLDVFPENSWQHVGNKCRYTYCVQN